MANEPYHGAISRLECECAIRMSQESTGAFVLVVCVYINFNFICLSY